MCAVYSVHTNLNMSLMQCNMPDDTETLTRDQLSHLHAFNEGVASTALEVLK